MENKDQVTLVLENEFSKTFEYGDIKLVCSKAMDEETDTHYIVASIPEIKELEVLHIQFPFTYESVELRDKAFNDFSTEIAYHYIEDVKKFIIDNQRKAKEEEEIKAIQNHSQN